MSLEACRPIVKDFALFARWRAVRVIALMALVTILEGAGLVLLVPLLALLGIGGKNSAAQSIFAMIFSKLGLTPTLPLLLCVYVGLISVHWAMTWRRDLASSHLAHGFVDHLRQRLFDNVGAAEWSFLAGTQSVHFSHALTSDISRISAGTHAVLQSITTGFTTLVYVIIAIHLSPAFALTAMVTGGLLLLTLRNHRRQTVRLGFGLTNATRRVHGEIIEFLAGLKLAKSSNTEARLSASFAAGLQRSSLCAHEFVARQAAARGPLRIGGASAMCVMLYLGSSVSALPATLLLALIFIFTRLFALLSDLQQQYERLLHTIPAYAAYLTMWEDCQRFKEPTAPAQRYSLSDAIRLQNLCYRPFDGTVDTLHDISLTIPIHKTTAFVGPSGAGKSTLAELVSGLLAPRSGRILIDGRELNDRRGWRDRVAFVPQDAFLFNSTLRENLLWTVPTASDADIWDALKQAAAADFVNAMPQGLDTVLGERGMRLSGGERQRLVIARTLMSKPLLLVLDEATSALDRDNEQHIQDTLAKLHGHLTVIVIAHRETSLSAIDHTVRLYAGRVVESRETCQ